MGIVLNQSFKNTLIVYLAFAVGGINTLFLYTRFLDEDYYGLVTFLLSSSNLLMPLTAFGVQYTIVKFYSSYESKLERDKFLSLAMVLPLLIAIPLGFLGSMFYEQISEFLSIKNPIIKEYTLNEWSETFNDLLKHKYNLIKIQNGSIKTAKQYSWNQRVLKIMKASKK